MRVVRRGELVYALHEAGYGPITFTNRTVEKASNYAAEIPNSYALSLTEAEGITAHRTVLLSKRLRLV